MTTFTEVADTLARITERLRLPVIVDAWPAPMRWQQKV
ncbi:MAG: 2-methylisocitrate lyase-like PEP mutase family enzyme [Rhodoferax sp.]